MLKFIRGNLFESNAQTLVNTVNCVGVMGKGVARAFREKYPEMYEDYRQKCAEGEIRPGVLTIYKQTQPWVLNFPTKRHWKAGSHLDDVEAGLKAFCEHYQEWRIHSIAMPALGCGNGGLDWADVRTLLERYLNGLDIDIEVYEPGSEAQPLKKEAGNKVIMVESPLDLFGNPVERKKAKRRRQRRAA